MRENRIRNIWKSGGTVINGTLNSTPSTSFTLEFFFASTDPSGFGEGNSLLIGQVVARNAHNAATRWQGAMSESLKKRWHELSPDKIASAAKQNQVKTHVEISYILEVRKFYGFSAEW